MNPPFLKVANFVPFSAKHFQNNDFVQVFPLDGTHAISADDILKIVEICNQSPIYNFLFAARLKGEPYTEKSANGIVEWARAGWNSGKYFVFLSRDSGGKILGAIDIKSDTIDGAEIGYWMDENSPGYMSNIVMGVAKYASEAGFYKLIAYTQPQNEKSQRVLLRAGFRHVGQVDHIDDDGDVHELFELMLNNDC
jgi:RimJ/RimL family protein N-acetyltransferase